MFVRLVAGTSPALAYDLGTPIVPDPGPVPKPYPAVPQLSHPVILLQKDPNSILKVGAVPGVGTFISGAAGLNLGMLTLGNAGPVPDGPAGAATATGVLVTAFGLMLAPSSSSLVGSMISSLFSSPYPFSASPFLLVVVAE